MVFDSFCGTFTSFLVWVYNFTCIPFPIVQFHFQPPFLPFFFWSLFFSLVSFSFFFFLIYTSCVLWLKCAFYKFFLFLENLGTGNLMVGVWQISLIELSEIKLPKFHNVADKWNINKNQRIKKNLKIFIGYLQGFEHTLINALFKVAGFKLPLK